VNEIRILASLNHVNVVGYKEAFMEGKYLCIFMEFADSGDLMGKIEEFKRKGVNFPEDRAWKIFI
jgi:NIMA (never in mitosis gene a)-related kinase